MTPCSVAGPSRFYHHDDGGSQVLRNVVILTTTLHGVPTQKASTWNFNAVKVSSLASSNQLSYKLRSSEPPSQRPSWRATACRLSETAYSIYSRLLSLSGCLPSICNLATRHAVVTRDPPNVSAFYIYIVKHSRRYICTNIFINWLR